MRSLGTIETSTEHTLLLSVAGGSLRILDASSTVLKQTSAVSPCEPGKTCGFTLGRLGLDTALGWATTLVDGQGNELSTANKDLVFVADGVRGVDIFDVTRRTAPVFVTRFALLDPGDTKVPPVPPDTASDVTVDPRGHLLYVAASGGLWVFDIGRMKWTKNADGTVTPARAGLRGPRCDDYRPRRAAGGPGHGRGPSRARRAGRSGSTSSPARGWR